ncbi:MAG: nucleotide exchange factor GrpE, partial [Thermoplasmatota archaeon]
FDDDEDDDEKSSGRSEKVRAKKVPISDGVKRRLLKNMREIARLKEEVKELDSEKDTYERELELLEEELENVRSEKDSLMDDINQKIAMNTAYEKKIDRIQKDFDNYKRRTGNEIERETKLGKKKLFLGLIDVLDNLDRAMNEGQKYKGVTEVNHILIGVESINKSLLKTMHDNGVDVIDPLGDQFDPKFHEAIEMIDDKDEYENTVMDVDSKGYLMDDFVLRPAKVRVSRGGKTRAKKKKILEEEVKGESDTEDEVEELEELDEIEEMDEE